MYTQEVTAIAEMRTILAAQAQYRSQFGHCAESLQELAAAGMIEKELASGAHAGYRFALQECTVSAAPTVFNQDGSRTFTSDESMAIHEHYGPESATPDDPKSQ